MALKPRHRFILRIILQTYLPFTIARNQSDDDQQCEIYKKRLERLLQTASIMNRIDYFFTMKDAGHYIFFMYLPPYEDISDLFLLDYSRFHLSSESYNIEGHIENTMDSIRWDLNSIILEGSNNDGHLILTARHDLLWCTHPRVYFRKKNSATIDPMISLDSTMTYGTFCMGESSIFTIMRCALLHILYIMTSKNSKRMDNTSKRNPIIRSLFVPKVALGEMIQEVNGNICRMEGILLSLLVSPKCYGLKMRKSSSNLVLPTFSLCEKLSTINCNRINRVLLRIENYYLNASKNIQKDPWEHLSFLPSFLQYKNQYLYPQFEIFHWNHTICQIRQIHHQISLEQLEDNVLKLLSSLLNTKLSSVPSKSTTFIKSHSQSAWVKIRKKINAKHRQINETGQYFLILLKLIENLNGHDELESMISEGIPSLISSLKVSIFGKFIFIIFSIHTIARTLNPSFEIWKQHLFEESKYFSSKTFMTNLISKICNLLVMFCRDRVKSSCHPDKKSFWHYIEQDTYHSFSSSLNKSIELYQKFRHNFRIMRDELFLSSNFRSCDVPAEEDVLLRLKIFSQRCRVTQMVTSYIKKIDIMLKNDLKEANNILSSLLTTIKSFQIKYLNPLDCIEDKEFDIDFAVIEIKYNKTLTKIYSLVKSLIEKAATIKEAQDLFDKWFETKFLVDCENSNKNKATKKLVHPNVLIIFRRFQKIVYIVESMYEQLKECPPVPRNTPFTSGSILWLKELLRRIKGLHWFLSIDDTLIFGLHDVKKKCKTLVWACTEYEARCLKKWNKEAAYALSSLDASLWFCPPIEQDALGIAFINLDPNILRFIKDSKIFQRLNIPVSDTAKIFLMHEAKLNKTSREVVEILRQFNECKETAARYKGDNYVAQFYVNQLETKIVQGMKSIAWTCPSVDSYLQEFKRSMFRLKKHIEIIQEKRNNINLKIVNILRSSGQLYHNEKEYDFQYLSERIRVMIIEKEQYLMKMNMVINIAIENVSELAVLNPDNFFRMNQSLEALLLSKIKNQQSALLALKEKAILYNLKWFLTSMIAKLCRMPKHVSKNSFCIRLQAKLSPKILSLAPSFDEISSHLKRIFKDLFCRINIIVDQNLSINSVKYLKDDLKSSMMKGSLILTSFLGKLKTQLYDYLFHNFSRFDNVWKGANDFLYSSTLLFLRSVDENLDQTKKRIRHLERSEIEIRNLPEQAILGYFLVCTREMKVQLLDEANNQLVQLMSK